jgi:hypothetical protein
MSPFAHPDLAAFDVFDQPAFQADLRALAGGTREEAQRWAAKAELIARLAAQVPDDNGYRKDATPWNSFVREIAVALRCSDQTAGKEIYLSVALVDCYPRTLAMLKCGSLPVYNARALLEEAAPCEPDVVAAIDAELAEKACQLTPARIRAAVRQIELRIDGDAAAARSAKATSLRNVSVVAQRDDQATMVISGPALPVIRFYNTKNAAARAARAAGDDRTLDALRFDIAVDVPDQEDEPSPDPALPADDAEAKTTAVGLPTTTRPAWIGDRRRLRPIKILLQLPVTTALGLDNEPGWLPGYGWVSAPQCRQWLPVAELQQVCVAEDGFVVDMADRVVRPTTTPEGVREAVLAMVRNPGEITEKTYREEPRHDPSPAVAEFVDVRDMCCDGPTGTRVTAENCDRDHEQPYPAGPTAAWNLINRARRTHVLKHNGWTPLRTTTSTLWLSPALQIVEIPHQTGPPPDISSDAYLPDPTELHKLEAELLRPPGLNDEPPF